MELPEDEILQRHAKQCAQGKRNCLLPNEYGITCITCSYNVIKQKHELTKSQRKKEFH